MKYGHVQNSHLPIFDKEAMFELTSLASPFLKWAGGKSKLLQAIKVKYPYCRLDSITKYAEPFVGGGAVLFDVLNKFDFKDVFISDINKKLIDTYIFIRDEVEDLIDRLLFLQNEYLSLGAIERKLYYFDKREAFNRLKGSDSSQLETAALFIFLNQTCFNGLYRVNLEGEFNTSKGSDKGLLICDEDNLRAVSRKLKQVQIVHGDYRVASSFIDGGTFAYFDPPYRPLPKRSGHTSYSREGFSDDDHIALSLFIDAIVKKGAYVIASNSDPKSIDETDNFFDELYSKYEIIRVDTVWSIGPKRDGGCKLSELLIVAK